MTVEDMCEIAHMATYKCYIGNIYNPICVAALGVDIACVGYQIWKWLS